MVSSWREEGAGAHELIVDVVWPTIARVLELHRADQISEVAHHYAARILRQVAAGLALSVEREAQSGQKVLLLCGDDDAEEASAQVIADLLECDGHEVLFAGAGLAVDDILAEIGSRSADILLLFAGSAADAPRTRQIIDFVREMDAWPDLRIVVGGGVFARAEGLADEILADACADDPISLLVALSTVPDRPRRAKAA